MNLKNIVYENDIYYVLKVTHGFEVYKQGINHATRCAIIGYEGEKGIARAIKEIERRKAA